MPAFIRSDGIHHTWPWRSISSQVAPLASPDRAAVITRNRKHNLAGVEAWDASTVSSADPTSWYGSDLRCAFTFGIGGNAPSIASPAGLFSIKPCAIAHRKTVPHPLAYPTGCLRPGRPYWGEDSQNVASVYSINRRAAKRRHSVTLQGLHPAFRVLGVTPTRFVRLMDGAGGFPKTWRRKRALVGKRIATLHNSGAVFSRLFASFSQAYGWKSTQANIASVSVDGDSQDPRLASRLADVQVQTSAIGVSSRFVESLNSRRRQCHNCPLLSRPFPQLTRDT